MLMRWWQDEGSYITTRGKERNQIKIVAELADNKICGTTLDTTLGLR